MATPSSDISRILNFWFDPRYDVKRWFMVSPEMDDQIKREFGALAEKARSSSIDFWSTNPTEPNNRAQGTLALIILLDQFSRNLYRGSPESYSSDAKAVDLALRAIARGDDKKLEGMQPAFFYLPLMHDENLRSQIASVALYEGMVTRNEANGDEKVREFARTGLGSAISHRDVIEKFGRFPSRNSILGRESSIEETEFLKGHPSGF